MTAQEALDLVVKPITNSKMEKAVNLLQILVDRDTSQTIKEKADSALTGSTYVGECPNCRWYLEWAENIRSGYEFCPICGQRLDRREKE